MIPAHRAVSVSSPEKPHTAGAGCVLSRRVTHGRCGYHCFEPAALFLASAGLAIIAGGRFCQPCGRYAPFFLALITLTLVPRMRVITAEKGDFAC